MLQMDKAWWEVGFICLKLDMGVETHQFLDIRRKVCLAGVLKPSYMFFV